MAATPRPGGVDIMPSTADVDPPGPATLLFDDDCASCWLIMDRMLCWGALRGVSVTPWQWLVAQRLPVDRGRPGREILLIRDAEVLDGVRALTSSLRGGQAGWPVLGRILQLPLLRRVAAAAYRLLIVDRHRQRADGPAERPGVDPAGPGAS
jgi:hypothetical protein